ncbi:MAG: DNA adenine methylase [Actinomycetota bacterium]
MTTTATTATSGMPAPFTYLGGKIRLAPKIVSLLPPHRIYIEPFFGSGAVLFAKAPAPVEIVNDANGDLVTFFRVLRDRPADLERACALSPHARDEFNHAKATTDESGDEVERARRFWVRVNQSFAKTAHRTTGWSISSARNQSIPASIRTRLGRFADCAERLARVSIDNTDATTVIERHASPDTVIYADPPYLGTTRNLRGRHGDYAVDMPKPAEHEHLAHALNTTSARVVLSGYPSPLYDHLYRGWNRIEIPTRVHTGNATAGTTRQARTEVLWTNYDPPHHHHHHQLTLDENHL